MLRTLVWVDCGKWATEYQTYSLKERDILPSTPTIVGPPDNDLLRPQPHKAAFERAVTPWCVTVLPGLEE